MAETPPKTGEWKKEIDEESHPAATGEMQADMPSKPQHSAGRTGSGGVGERIWIVQLEWRTITIDGIGDKLAEAERKY